MVKGDIDDLGAGTQPIQRRRAVRVPFAQLLGQSRRDRVQRLDLGVVRLHRRVWLKVGDELVQKRDLGVL